MILYDKNNMFSHEETSRLFQFICEAVRELENQF